jgi:diacylglycerol kinase family enzyme
LKRVLLIVNPYSSAVTARRVQRVSDILRSQANLGTELTRAPGHATELAAQAVNWADAVVVLAGDGTYNEAINGLTGDVPVGFIPGGGTSVLPRALGLPRGPVAAAQVVAKAIHDGRTRRISLGRVNGRRFAFSAGIGLDAEAVRRIDARGRTDAGRRPGDLAFAATVVGMFARARLRFEPVLEIAGVGRAAFVMVANGSPYSFAGPVPLQLVPGARFEEGLAFVAPAALSPGTVPRLAARALSGRLDEDAVVLAGNDVDSIEVRCDDPQPLQADGEDLGDVTEASFVAERDALAVLV